MKSVTIKTDLPQKLKHRRLSPTDKWVHTVLISNPMNEATGIYEIDPHVLADYCELDPTTVRASLVNLMNAGVVVMDGNVVFVPELIASFSWQRESVRMKQASKVYLRFKGTKNLAFRAWLDAVNLDVPSIVADDKRSGMASTQQAESEPSNNGRPIIWGSTSAVVAVHDNVLHNISNTSPSDAPNDPYQPLQTSNDPYQPLQTLPHKTPTPYERLAMKDERLTIDKEGGAGGDSQQRAGEAPS
jgi:hypothetical protein